MGNKEAQQQLKVWDRTLFVRTKGDVGAETPALVIVHGGPGGCHHAMWPLHVLAQGRSVVFYDQADCGLSERKNNPRDWTFERSVMMLEALIKTLGLRHYAVLGHSYGGAVALAHAAQHPTGLTHLILSSPLVNTLDWIHDTRQRIATLPKKWHAALLPSNPDISTAAQWQEAMAVFNQNFLCRLNPLPHPYLEAKKQFNHLLYQTMWGAAEFSCTGTLAQLDLKGALPKVVAPTLWLCGGYDEILPGTLKNYQAKMTKPSLLKVLPSASHTGYLEQPKHYIQAVHAFLAHA